MRKTMAAAAVLAVFIAAQLFARPAAGPAQVKVAENLKAAITGETTASTKYAAYGRKAREEGYVRIALLFEAASRAEAIHAANHRAVAEQMGSPAGEIQPSFTVKSTRENLEDALKGESYEVSTMYPAFIKTAGAAKANAALLSFNYAYQTEQKHKALYARALKALDQKTVESLPATYLVCVTCGNTYDTEAGNRCAFCLTPKEKFVTFQ